MGSKVRKNVAFVYVCRPAEGPSLDSEWWLKLALWLES
jgi:hypothetical protein